MDRVMKRIFSFSLLCALLTLLSGTASFAASTVEKFEIEGLISAASPKALIAALESELKVKVVGLNLKNTVSGWPMLSVEFDAAQTSIETIEKTIANIEDPAGHKYRVHSGPPFSNAAFTEEELKAMAMFGPAEASIPAVTNPINSSEDSAGRGKQLFQTNCATCHGLDGGGQGPAAHGITTFPRQLWVWSSTDSSADGYLYWIITNGRNEMPPWGLVLSEDQRWDVINYIRTMKQPG